MCPCADSKEFERQLQASLVTSMMLGDSYPLANQPGNGEFTIPKSYECLCQVGFLSMSSFLIGRNCLGSPLDTHIHIYPAGPETVPIKRAFFKKIVILPQCRADLMIGNPGKTWGAFFGFSASSVHRHRCNACTVISWQSAFL